MFVQPSKEILIKLISKEILNNVEVWYIAFFNYLHIFGFGAQILIVHHANKKQKLCIVWKDKSFHHLFETIN